MPDKLLELKDLKMYFKAKKTKLSKKDNYIKAVDGISLSIKKGETFGIVGESGCGKSTTGRMILRLLEPTQGEVIYKNENILDYNKRQMKSLRREIQMIFQDPYSSLNPRLKVSEIIKEVLVLHKIVGKKQLNKKVIDLLNAVGLGEQHLDRYPHEFSGGQRQRIGIARALAVNPELIICDEPVSALDVSIQAQIINLMKEIQKERELTYIFISHDLSVVHHLCDRIAVMYLGKIVELSNKDEIFGQPKHPYTKALLNAIPNIEEEESQPMPLLTGDMPSPADPPKGCRFHTRCPYAMDICKTEEPNLERQEDDHLVACHLFIKEKEKSVQKV